MNLSKKCSDLSLSPLNIGGGTPDRALLPLVVLFSAGGAGVVTVAAIYLHFDVRGSGDFFDLGGGGDF